MKNKIAFFCIAALALVAGLLGSVAITNMFGGDVKLALILFAAAFLFGYAIGIATYAIVYGKQ